MNVYVQCLHRIKSWLSWNFLICSNVFVFIVYFCLTESVDKPCAIPRLLNKTDRSLSLELSCPPGHTAADYDCSITQYSVRYRIANINSEFSTQTVPSPMLTISNLIPYTVYEINAQAQYQHSYCTSKNASFSPSLTTRLKPEGYFLVTCWV